VRREISLPVVRFGDLFDDGIAFAKEGQHVTAKEEGFGEWAKDGKRSGDPEQVFHLGGAGG